MVGSIFHPPGSARTISGIFLWYEFPANKGGWTISYLPPTELRGTSIPTTIFNIRHPSLYRGTQACTDMICENGLTFNSVGKAVIEPVEKTWRRFWKNCGFPCHNGGWLGTSKKKNRVGLGLAASGVVPMDPCNDKDAFYNPSRWDEAKWPQLEISEYRKRSYQGESSFSYRICII